MERGPLPPHERAWRHPSEVAAEERALIVAEPSPRGARLLALATGTAGLLAIGLLVITITPARNESPILLSASTTPVATARADEPTAFATSGSGRAALRSDRTGVLATPIGDGRFALVTRESVAGTTDATIDVILPSGTVSAGSIVTASDDTVVVALTVSEPGHAIAPTLPHDHDMVTVMASPPITVAFDDVGTLSVDEGTAVLDGKGHLVGICSRRDGSRNMRLIEVSRELDAATSVVP